MATVPSENKRFNAKNGLSVGSPPIDIINDQGALLAAASQVRLTNTTANSNYYIPFAAGSTTGNYGLGVDPNLYYNPATNFLSYGNLSGGGIYPSVIDFGDGSSTTEHLRFGSSLDAKFFYNGTANTMNLELEAAAVGFVITDNGTTKFTFEKTTGNLEIDGGIKQKQITYDVVATQQSIDFAASSNFLVNLGINSSFTFTNLTSSIGASGYIFIKQNSGGGKQFTLPVEAKTPGGRTITQVTAANSLSLITYYIVDNQTVIVNYIADFK